jgi:hypothetical protein
LRLGDGNGTHGPFLASGMHYEAGHGPRVTQVVWLETGGLQARENR